MCPTPWRLGLTFTASMLCFLLETASNADSIFYELLEVLRMVMQKPKGNKLSPDGQNDPYLQHRQAVKYAIG